MLSRLDEKGRLLIPAELRRKLGFQEKDTVLIESSGPGEFRVIRLEEKVKEARGMYSHVKDPGEDMTADFINERRQEAKREQEGKKDAQASS